jgi:uncharacterized protein
LPTAPLQVITEHYAASARGDLDGMVADFAPGVAWTEMEGFPYAGTYIGPEAVIANVFQRLGGEWDDYRAMPEHILSDGDEVVAFGLYTGVFRATGKALAARFVHHWTVSDGQVVRFEQYTDTKLFADAMS